MFIAIIVSDREERKQRLTKELQSQGIDEYTIFPAIHHWRSAKEGINAAHKSVVAYAKEADFDEVCVMEDDICFTHSGSFNFFRYKEPIEFDLYLGGIYVGDLLADNTVKSFSGLHLYIIKKRFYDTFLNLPSDEHIDRALDGLGEYVVCNPFVAIQTNGYSHNSMKEENYDRLLDGRQLYDGSWF